MLFPLFKAKVSCAAEVLATKYLSQGVHTHSLLSINTFFVMHSTSDLCKLLRM